MSDIQVAPSEHQHQTAQEEATRVLQDTTMPSSLSPTTSLLLQWLPDLFLYCADTFLSDIDAACLAACNRTTLAQLRRYGIKLAVPLNLRGSVEHGFFHHPSVYDVSEYFDKPKFLRAQVPTIDSASPTRFSFGVVSAIDIFRDDCQSELILTVLHALPRSVKSIYFRLNFASRNSYELSESPPPSLVASLLTQECFPSHIKRIIFRHCTGSDWDIHLLLPPLSSWRLPDSLTTLQLPYSVGAIDQTVEIRDNLSATRMQPIPKHGSAPLSSDDLAKVQFPAGLTSLCWFQQDCSKLSALRLPDSLVSLQLGQFWDLSHEHLPPLPPNLQSLSITYGATRLAALLRTNKIANLLELDIQDAAAIDYEYTWRTTNRKKRTPPIQVEDFSNIEFPPKLMNMQMRNSVPWLGATGIHFSSNLHTMVLKVRPWPGFQFPPQLTTLYMSQICHNMRFPPSLKNLYIGYLPEEVVKSTKIEFEPPQQKSFDQRRHTDSHMNSQPSTDRIVLRLPEGLECANIRLGWRLMVASTDDEQSTHSSWEPRSVPHWPDEFEYLKLLDPDESPWGVPESIRELSLYDSKVAHKSEDIRILVDEVLTEFQREDLNTYYEQNSDELSEELLAIEAVESENDSEPVLESGDDIKDNKPEAYAAESNDASDHDARRSHNERGRGRGRGRGRM